MRPAARYSRVMIQPTFCEMNIKRPLIVFVDETETSRKILSLICKKRVPHQLVTEKSIVEGIKKELDFSPPIVLYYDDKAQQYVVLENKKELLEVINGKGKATKIR